MEVNCRIGRCDLEFTSVCKKIFQNWTILLLKSVDSVKKTKKMHFFYQNILVYQKKAVLLHPLSTDGSDESMVIASIAQLVEH